MAKNDAYEKFLNKDVFYTQEEIAKQYGPSVKKSTSSSLVLKKEDLFLKYKETNLISINKEKKVSKNLIHDLLSDEGMYKYLQTNLDNELGIAARLDFIIDSESIASIKITRREFIEALYTMRGELSQKEQMRSAVIKSSWLLFSCEQRYRNFTHCTYLNDTYLNIPASDLLRILTLPEKEFDLFVKGNLSFGYAKEILAYALVDFVERERIMIKYVLPEAIVNRYEQLKDYSIIDFESLNKNRIKNDLDSNGESIIEKIKISDELREYLDAELDPTYSNLEKAIYYYIKLCNIFSLDENYYLSKSSSILEEHQNIQSINNKKPKDKVAMYDFFTIYASLLAELNLDYTLSQSLMVGYEMGNTKLTFKYGEYLVAISSLVNPEESDIINVKVNEPLVNICSINQNKTTKNKFNEMTTNIYEAIKEKQEKRQVFETALNNYRKNINETVSLKDRLYVLLKEIVRTDLKGMDIVGYERKIFKQLFQNDKDISLNILAKPNEEINYLTPVTVISLLDKEYIYIVIDETSDDIIRDVSMSELTSLLSLGVYYYVDNSDPIPGISRYVGDKFVR